MQNVFVTLFSIHEPQMKPTSIFRYLISIKYLCYKRVWTKLIINDLFHDTRSLWYTNALNR